MSDQQIKDAGLKVTSSRVKILKVLETAQDHHMSAEDVYRSMRDSGEIVGMATVYRVLTQFEAAGIVNRHKFEGDYAVYELNQGKHHDHLVCVRCGLIEEFVDQEIEKRQKEIAKQYGFEMTDHDLNVFGICPNCKDAKLKEK